MPIQPKAFRFLLSSCRYSSTLAPVRTRFAPSPTGLVHLGGLRTALFNYVFAKQKKGQFILRVEDTDRKRLVPTAVENLLQTLHWAGIEYDEGAFLPWCEIVAKVLGPEREGPYGPYVQSKRLDIYRKHLEILVQQKHAYPCFCSGSRLEKLRQEATDARKPYVYDRHCLDLSKDEVQEKLQSNQPRVYRFKTSDSTKQDGFDDLIYGRVEPKVKDASNFVNEDFIIIKADGFPTYHFANVVDDHEMRISHVLRGEEWIPSTPKHLALYNAFGWSPPIFAHMPIMVAASGKKLSKREGDVSIEHFQAAGWEPEAVNNFVALLSASWRNRTPERNTNHDVLTMQNMIEHFDIGNVTRHRSIPFKGKLEFLNRTHLQHKVENQESLNFLAQRLQELLVKNPAYIKSQQVQDLEYVKRVIQVLVTQVDKLDDINDSVETQIFFQRPGLNTAGAKKMLETVYPEDYLKVLKAWIAHFQSLASSTTLNAEQAGATLEKMRQQTQIVGRSAILPLRHALTGKKAGPAIVDIISVLGVKECLHRFKVARNRLEKPESAENSDNQESV